MKFALDSVTTRPALIVHVRAKEYIHISLILRRNAYISTTVDIVLDNCSETLFI